MADDAKYLTLTDENFQAEVLESSTPVLVDFWAEWCGPCRMIAPTVEEVAADYEGKAKVGKLNIDHHMKTASDYGIRSIPTLLVFKDGKVVDQIVGAVNKSVLTSKLDSQLESVA